MAGHPFGFKLKKEFYIKRSLRTAVLGHLSEMYISLKTWKSKIGILSS